MKKYLVLSVLVMSLILSSCGENKNQKVADEFCKTIDTIKIMPGLANIPVMVEELKLKNTLAVGKESDLNEIMKMVEPCIFNVKAKVGLSEGKRIAFLNYDMLKESATKEKYQDLCKLLAEMNKSWEENPQYKLSYKVTMDSLLTVLDKKFGV